MALFRNFAMHIETFEQLERLNDITGIPMSRLVDEAVQEYIDNNAETINTARQRKSKRSQHGNASNAAAGVR